MLATILPELPKGAESLLPLELQSIIALVTASGTGSQSGSVVTQTQSAMQTGAAATLDGWLGVRQGGLQVCAGMGAVVVGGLAVLL